MANKIDNNSVLVECSKELTLNNHLVNIYNHILFLRAAHPRGRSSLCLIGGGGGSETGQEEPLGAGPAPEGHAGRGPHILAPGSSQQQP